MVKKTGKDKFADGSGRYRGYFVLERARLCEKAVAWCLVPETGDVAAIQELLGRIRGLGTRRRNGHGAVKGIEVSMDPVAERNWVYRSLPQGSPHASPLHVPAIENLAPPYWEKSTLEPVLIPSYCHLDFPSC